MSQPKLQGVTPFAMDREETTPEPEEQGPVLIGTAVAGLLALCLVPSLAGGARLFEVLSGAQVTLANARFMDAPWPISIHILGSLVFGIGGALQFSSGIRKRYPGWHRLAGRGIAAAALASGISGLWMAIYYPWPELDGWLLNRMRLIVAVITLIALFMGVWHILNREMGRHRIWMTLAWALAMGAGTQVLTHLPFAFEPDWLSVSTRTLAMAAGWLINLLVAGWILRKSGVIESNPMG